jgi:hypothetical protein
MQGTREEVGSCLAVAAIDCPIVQWLVSAVTAGRVEPNCDWLGALAWRETPRLHLTSCRHPEAFAPRVHAQLGSIPACSASQSCSFAALSLAVLVERVVFLE